MSKHNNNHRNNYSKMYTAKEEIAEVEEDIVAEPEAVVEEAIVAEPEETVALEPEEVVEEIVNEQNDVEGIVSNCDRLNVRRTPSINAGIVTVLRSGTKLVIDVDKSNDEWYSICTLHGIEGYCMKKFITIND